MHIRELYPDVITDDLDEIDKTKNLIAKVNDRHISPHARVQYMMRSVDAKAEPVL